MRRMLISIRLVVGLAGVVQAEGDWSPENLVKVCNSNPQCLAQLAQIHQQGLQLDAQREMARTQAYGMAAFGAGHALINGMNQGFQNMQLKPIPPIAPYPRADGR